jgi:hypothetical protein
MTLLEDAPAAQIDADARALFEEARRRRRHRWLASGVVILAMLAVTLPLVLGDGANPRHVPPPVRPVTETHGGPTVDAAAMREQGHLAFVSQGTLWVLGDSRQPLIEVQTPGLVPSKPSFSPDGRWLTFVASKVSSHNYDGDVVTDALSSSLWTARADGTGAHPVKGLSFSESLGWSPMSDVVAVAVGSSTSAPFGLATGVDLVGPTGSIVPLLRGSHVVSATWGPGGANLAVSTMSGPRASSPWTGALASYRVSDGRPTQWLSLPNTWIVTSGWWPVWGIGFTTVDGGGVPGGSATADGSPLLAVSAPSGPTRLLGTILSNGSTGRPTASTTGWLAFVDDYGDGGRTVWQSKQIEVCAPTTLACVVLPHPDGTVTVDPAWLPDQDILSYAVAPDQPASVFLQSTVGAWYDRHQLSEYAPRTGTTTAISGVQGGADQSWSTHGGTVLYVSGDGLWLASGSQAPVEVARPLFTPGQLPMFYAQVPFASQFAWSAAR